MTPATAKKVAREALGKRKGKTEVEYASWDPKTLCITVTLDDGRGHTWSGPATVSSATVKKHFAIWLAKIA